MSNFDLEVLGLLGVFVRNYGSYKSNLYLI